MRAPWFVQLGSGEIKGRSQCSLQPHEGRLGEGTSLYTDDQ